MKISALVIAKNLVPWNYDIDRAQHEDDRSGLGRALGEGDASSQGQDPLSDQPQNEPGEVSKIPDQDE